MKKVITMLTLITSLMFLHVTVEAAYTGYEEVKTNKADYVVEYHIDDEETTINTPSNTCVIESIIFKESSNKGFDIPRTLNVTVNDETYKCRVTEIDSYVLTDNEYSDYNVKVQGKLSFKNAKYCNVINTRAFSKARNICFTTADLGNVKYVGQHAFSNNINLTSVTMDKVEYIDNYAFTECKNLQKVKMLKVKYIGARAFAQNKKLKTVTFGGKTKIDKISEYAFAYCNSLRTIKTITGLKSENRFPKIYWIGNNAFTHTDLRKIKLNCKRIDDFAFSNIPAIMYYNNSNKKSITSPNAFYGTQMPDNPKKNSELRKNK